MELNIVWNQPDEAIKVMKEVASWRRQKGYRVWLDEWLSREELITEEVNKENLCIGLVENNVACATILQWVDNNWWPNAKMYDACYIHKLCVRREFAGRGIPALLIEAIKLECRKRNTRYIRLDTGWDEEVVKRIYL
ncbi:MAG: hypothetical protein K0S47_2971 [Herbinix sp.]|nr:hypothetical protein [Herbinix sp.]